jgi:co-chaperonin GroES (HSP10)
MAATTCPLTPARYHLILKMRQMEQKTAGGIILTEQTVQQNSDAEVVGQVISVGPDAFADQTKFPSGASCKVGDWVVVKRYAPTSWFLEDVHYKIIPDTEIIATIDSPDDINLLMLKTRK